MNPLQQLADLGQSIWQDDIRRDMLDDGTLQQRIDDWAVTGLTSNPSIFDKAISGSQLYDDAIAALVDDGVTEPEELFFSLAIEDLRRAADLFAPAFERTGHVDGVVSLEVSPLLADDTEATIDQATELFERAQRPNVMIKIPGTPAGLPAITESISRGIPINVTLLFSVDQYLAQAEAWLQGLERRLDAGESVTGIPSVASIFVSRWDVAANEQLPGELHNQLGIAVCAKAYAAYRSLLSSDRVARVLDAGASPQRLLFASTSTKDPEQRDTAYVEALSAPDTVNTLPQETLAATVEHGDADAISDTLSTNGGGAVQDIARLQDAGVDVEGLAAKLQQEGKQKFVDSWESLLDSLRDQV